jgi:hypothetical protein
MTNPYRALCAELDALLNDIASTHPNLSENGVRVVNDLSDRARALLTQPVAEEPSDEEARELADDLGITRGFFDHECGLHISCADLEPFARAVLARWGRPKPPSLAKRALHILGTHGDLSCAEHDTIRCALEALDD